MDESENMKEHRTKMSNLVHQFSALWGTLAEQLTVVRLLSSLPGSYATLITALERRPEKDFTQEFVKNMLI